MIRLSHHYPAIQNNAAVNWVDHLLNDQIAASLKTSSQSVLTFVHRIYFAEPEKLFHPLKALELFFLLTHQL